MSGFIDPHDAAVKQAALSEFKDTWQEYSSPSAAARAIAGMHGVGRTTLVEWAHDAGVWPVASIAELRRLQAENKRLRSLLQISEEQ
jgi:hypothetical protein